MNSDDFKTHSATLEIISPKTGKVMEGVTLEVVGRFSTQFYEASNEIDSNATIFENRSRKAMIDEANTLMSACVIDWDEKFFKGPCTRENVLAMLQTPHLGFVRLQLKAHFDTNSRFFSPPEPNSDDT